MTRRVLRWWSVVRNHPYADIAVLGGIVFMLGGGVRWWSRPSVLLTVDGVTRRLHPKAVTTVGDALAKEQIVVGPEDICTPELNTPLQRNTPVHITRVTHGQEVVFEHGNPRIYWRVQLKANLRPVLIERGFVQESSQTVRVTYHDGVKITGQVLRKKTARRPIFTLTLFDRQTNQPAKVYDLAKAKHIVMRATGYYVGEKYVPSDTTYLGFKLRRGLVAVDPKVIPLRTRLYIKGYGYAYAADTGSAIKGKRIDLAVKGRKEEAQFNRKQITVYVLEKASTW